MVLLAGVFLGRLLCGWVCPLGLLQDLLHKIPSVKISLPHWTSYAKYGLLFFMVFLIPYLWAESTLYSFCRICPAGTLQASLPSAIASRFAALQTATLVRWGVLLIILVFAVVSARSFCKVLCPLGALLAPLNYLSFWTIQAPPETCLSCKKCDAACSMDIQPSARIDRGIPANRILECIVCHECQTACIHGKKESASEHGESAPARPRCGASLLQRDSFLRVLRGLRGEISVLARLLSGLRP